MKDRYFIVSYFFGNNGLGTGIMGIKSNKYPNQKLIKEASTEDGTSIINIIELSEEDYISFWRKDEN